MDRDYFDLDAIFAESQKLSCTFKPTVPGLGYLDGGKERDIKEKQTLQLPFWLAMPLCYAGSTEFVIPAPFAPRVRNALNADPRAVRLSALVGVGNHWYAHGMNVTQLLPEDDAKKMAEMLHETFQKRLMDLMDQAQNFAGAGTGLVSGSGGSADPGQEFREGLDQTERELFVLAQEATRRTKTWSESSDRTGL